MSEGYYEPGSQRAAKVRDLFGAIAGRYDLLNDLQSFGLHRAWKRRLARLAEVGPGRRALDVCCGTGDVTLALAATGAEVVGVDFSEPMLSVARERKPPGARVRFLPGDALQLPFADAGFDAVTISYGLRNLADIPAGLRELWRVARPGGRVLVLDFGKPAHPLWRGLYFAYLRGVVPVLGRLFSGNAPAYAYISESLRHYPAQAGITALFQELGAARLTVHNLLGGIMSIHVAAKPAVAP